ncbi:MAG TPA: hypothetical protein VG122_20780 [Gemmata sp.]|nr:hypothetical protein [Gemmata sp.]
MWHWIKRWIDWLRNDALPLTRMRRSGSDVFFQYQVGVQTHHDLPIPWTAEMVTVEVQLCLPPSVRKKADFTLRFPDVEPIPADAIRPELGDRHRVVFRFPVPRTTVACELLWKHRVVAPITIPVLTPEMFLANLQVAMPTITVRLVGQGVSACAYVADECKGLIASAVLRSPYVLASVAELGLWVEFLSERTGRLFSVRVPLSASQCAGNEAVVTAACPKVPRRVGLWSVIWRVGKEELARRRVEVIPARRFEESLRVLDTRFAVADKAGMVRVVRQPPPAGTVESLGPCFLIASSEAGAVGMCRLALFVVSTGEQISTQLMTQETLVTDAPMMFAPGLVGTADLARVGGFELRLNGRIIGTASLSPVPPAVLTAEGGFKPPPDFTWTAAAEDELIDRLRRLGSG